jgi:hypothetical protein
MGYKLPNGATIQHAATYDTVLPFTELSNATEAVAKVTGATLAAGDIVLVTSAWSRLNNRVVRVKAATATAITLEAIDTTDLQLFPAGSGVGTLKKVLTWVAVPQVVDVAYSGGDQNYTDVVFLEDDQGRQIPTDKAASSMALTIADDPALPHNAVLSKADAKKQIEAARMNLPGNDTIFYGTYTSFSKQPTITRNNVMARTVNLALQAEPTRYTTVAGGA